MIRGLVGLTVGLLAFSVFANDYNNNEIKQDGYILGEISQNEIENFDGNRAGLIFGVRNIYPNRFFVGGELAGAIYDNKLGVQGNVDTQYSASAYIPVGRQFELSNEKTVNLFGIVGYSSVRLESTTTSASEVVDGMAWGIGTDTNFGDWIVGIRYVVAQLDDLDEKNLSLTVGYKL